MGPDSEKGEILSTWKEIAAYLDSSVRTCIRWEKESGLPVHRQEGAPRSRIFAYKNELDDWFKSRLSNGSIHPENGSSTRPLWRKPYLYVPLALVLLGAAIWVAIRSGSPINKSKPVSEIPQSSGPFEVSSTDILETEYASAGRLRVWRPRRQGDFAEAWRIEPVRHTSFAIGNLDEDGFPEVVAPGHCRIFEKQGDLTTSKIMFFLNAYKQNFKDWWKTTFFDPSQCICEKDNYEFTETVIADVDNAPGNEILLVSAHALSVFRYDPELGELRLTGTWNRFIEGVNTLLRSAVVADVDADGQNEILATANAGEEGAEVPDKAWLIVLRWQGGGPEVIRSDALPGLTSARALKIGDIVPGGPKEAIIACYPRNGQIREGHLLVWSYDQGIIADKFVDEVGEGQFGGLFIAAGDFSPDPGDEIMAARNNPGEIRSFFWRGQELEQGPKYGLDQNARVLTIQIGPPKAKGAYSCVLVSGTGEWEGQLGRYYLELINYGDGFFPEWVRKGGDKEDLRVSFADFVRLDNQPTR